MATPSQAPQAPGAPLQGAPPNAPGDGTSAEGVRGGPHKRLRLNFTLRQRQMIWLHSQANPKMKQQELACWAMETFNMDAEPSQSAISYAIRRHKQYEKLGEAEGKMKRPRNVKHPKLDTALAKWVSECHQSGTRISSLMVKEKAILFCERLHIPKSSRPSFSNGWLHAFNKRYGFRNYARHREVISDDVSLKAASSIMPRKPRGPYSIAFKRDVVRYYNFSDRDMQATLQEFFSGDKTAAALEKKRKFVIAWAREEERIEELMAYDNVTGMAPPRSIQTQAQAQIQQQQQQQQHQLQSHQVQQQQQQQHHQQQHQQQQRPVPIVSHMLTPAAEQVIVSWVIDMRQAGAPVSSAMLEQKAHDVAAEFGIQFTPSWNWRQEFLKRYSYPLGGYVPQSNPYEAQHRMGSGGAGVINEEHKQQDHGYAPNMISNSPSSNWRGGGGMSESSGVYGAPPGSHQALLLNMRGPQSTSSRFSIYQEQRTETERMPMDNHYYSAPQQQTQYQQPQPYQHHPQYQHQHYQQQPVQHQHYAHQPPVAAQAPPMPPPVLSHMQTQPVHTHAPIAPTQVQVAEQQLPVPAQAQAPTPAQQAQSPPLAPASGGTSTVPTTTTTTTEEPGAPSQEESQPTEPVPDAAAQAKSILNLGDKVVEARKVETKLRVEGLRYDNEIKRMKILEENILARKRLKDAGITQDEIDKLLPLVQFKQ